MHGAKWDACHLLLLCWSWHHQMLRGIAYSGIQLVNVYTLTVLLLGISISAAAGIEEVLSCNMFNPYKVGQRLSAAC